MKTLAEKRKIKEERLSAINDVFCDLRNNILEIEGLVKDTKSYLPWLERQIKKEAECGGDEHANP